jgi:hypothetical protein
MDYVILNVAGKCRACGRVLYPGDVVATEDDRTFCDGEEGKKYQANERRRTRQKGFQDGKR